MLGSGLFLWHQSEEHRRLRGPFRIGWERAAPEQLMGSKGQPTGAIVELVREAARRKGIALQWVESPESSEGALLSGRVDLWPLMTITEERKQYLHFSAPYIDSVLALWVLPGSALKSVSRLQRSTIAHLGIPVNTVLLRGYLPHAVGLPTEDPRAAIESLCRGEAAAAMLEQDEIVHELIRGGRACGNQGLEMIDLPGAKIHLAIASTKRAADVADAIRDQIDSMVEEGFVDRLFEMWGYVSGRTSAAVELLIEARRRERIGFATTLLLCGFLGLAVFQTSRYGRQVQRAKIAEELQRQSYSELLETQRIAGLGVWSCDLGTGTSHWSDELYRMAGLDPGENGLPYEERSKVFSPESAKKLQAAIAAAAQDGTQYQLELEMRRPDGSSSWVTVRGEAVRNHDGEIVGLRGTAFDITERKRILETLAETEGRLKLVLEAAKLGTYEWNVETGDLIWSQQTERIFGVAPNTFGGTYPDFAKAVYPEDLAKLEELVGQARNSGCTYSQEFRIILPDGSQRWIFSRGAFMGPDRGESLRMYGVALDITGPKLLEQQLQQAQRMESVGRLAGGVAHDFNNMLTVILGYAEQAKNEVVVYSGLWKKLTEIEKAASRSRDITQKLLGFSRQQVIEPVPLDLNELIGDLLEPLARLIGDDIELSFEPGCGLWPVEIDPSQVNQILLNLAVNARDAMPEGGRITVKTSNISLAPGRSSIHSGLDPGEYVMFSFTDTGIGMSEETKAHIFEPFFTTKGAGQGTGLGLATVYGIVTQNKGFVDVRTKPREGSSFDIYLPRMAGDSAPCEVDREPTSDTKCEGTILVVEDNELVRDLVSSSLQQFGYRVLIAEGPEEALVLMKREGHNIDGMLSDVVMPGMNGLELRDRVLMMNPEIRVLFMSGYASNVIPDGSYAQQGLQFIQKPFTIQELTDRMREVMAGAAVDPAIAS